MSLYLGTNEVNMVGLMPGNQLGHMGNSKLIAEKTYNIPLSQTNYASLTISTSAQTLTLPATSYSASGNSITALRVGEDYDGTAVNRELHDYVIIGKGIIDYVFTATNSVMNDLIHGVRGAFCRDTQFGKYYTPTSSGALGTTYSKSSTNLTSTAPIIYRKIDGTYGTTTSCGIYSTSCPSGSFSTSNSKDLLNLTLSSIYAKASASYFPVDAMNYIDTTNTILKFTWYVYEGDFSAYSHVYQTAYHALALS